MKTSKIEFDKQYQSLKETDMKFIDAYWGEQAVLADKDKSLGIKKSSAFLENNKIVSKR